MAKKAFRAESGLDSGGHLVRNVATPANNTDKKLGTNIEYFIRENTVQKFDKTRSYEKYFAVTHERRLYIAKINVPAGEFDPNDWDPIRVDPNWILLPTLDPIHGENYPLKSGDYISASSEFVPAEKEMRFILPDNPIDGDTIVIKDEGYYVHSRKMVVKSNKKPIEHNKTEELFTIPGSMKTFIYSKSKDGQWIVHTSIDKIQSKFVGKTRDPHQLSVGDQVYLQTGEGLITLQLPRYAVHGDEIVLYDNDGMGSVYGINVQVYPGTSHKFAVGSKTTYNSSAPHHFVFDGRNDRWDVYEDSQATRIKAISGNYTAMPRENIVINGGSGDLTVTLPRGAGNGDFVRISNYYRIDGLKIHVKVADRTGHKILGSRELYSYPKYKNLPTDVSKVPRVDKIDFSGLNLGAVAEFYYDASTKEWEAVYTHTRIEHVDESNRSRPGVAPLADQGEVNKNHEQNPRDDMIVTPKTLANKVSTESRRGISRIATAPELQLPTNGEHLNDVIVTPRRLNERQAKENIRGLAEIATQAEANSNDNDTHIITPKKLNARRAHVNNAGVVKIITTSASAAPNRTTPGTGVYNWSDSVHNEPYVLTPKALNQAQATENSRGVAYIATQSETNTQDTASDSLIVTPKKLDKRRALETLHGIGRLATQAEANAGSLHNSVFITPKTLHGRQATESMWGLTENATQSELNSGTDNFRYITPLKFKTWMAYNHFISETATGIEHTGNLWGNVTLKIRQATETQRGTLEVANQTEANAQGSVALDTAIITPKKLDARRATESLSGIAEIAGQAEVDAKSDHTRIVTPKTLGHFITKSSTSNMNEEQYGTGTTANMAETWVGNTTVGSTKSYTSYGHNPYVVSPRGLNYALQNYLPKTAKAVDSDKLDGLDSGQYLRSDVDDNIGGNLTFTGDKYLQWSRNTDFAKIGFKNTSDSDTDSYMYFVTGDNGNEYFKWQMNNGQTTTDIMKLNSNNLYYKTYQVYHEGHKPTPAEVGCYSKSESDGRFVNTTGDSMSGKLSITSNLAWHQIELKKSDSARSWSIGVNSDNSFSIVELTKGYPLKIMSGGAAIFSHSVQSPYYKVGSTTVIESDAKINWNKLKGVPNATTTYKGIVQLTDSFSSTSTTLGATASVIKVLKDMIDEKADITGGAMDDLKVKNWLQIGNVILRPNKATKSLDFIWTDVL